MRKFIPEIESSGLSIIGPVREDNQDAIHITDDPHATKAGFLFAIADGMGGYAHGGMASALALDSFLNVIHSQHGQPVLRTLQRGIETANLHVYQKARQMDAGRMGTTLTAAYILGDMLYLAHVGDSRAYLIRDGQATCLTSDHTTVGDMVRAKLIPAAKIRTHAQRSILTKSIGTDLFVQPDIIQQKLKPGDCLILCSDGLWSVVEDDDFAKITAQASSVSEISQELVDLALAHHTDDNVSVVSFSIRSFIPVSDEQEALTEESLGWFKKLRKIVS